MNHRPNIYSNKGPLIMEQRWDPKLWEKKRTTFQGQTRTLYRCKKQIKVGKTIYRCETQFRSDYSGPNEHTRTFESILHYFEPHIEIDNLYCHFIDHIIRSNISFSSAASSVTYDFIYSLIREGQRSVLINLPPNFEQKHNIPTPQTLFPKRSRQTIAKNTHDLANQKRSNIIQKISQKHYACLQIDAGKINGVPILDICVVHAFNSLKPLLYRAYRRFDGKKQSYKDYVKQVILELKIKGINITTLVGDNLPVQKSALDHSPGSLQEDNIETNVALPIFFPCICHTLSLALNDFIKDNETMSFLMDNIIIFTKIFRSKTICCTFGFGVSIVL